MDDYVQFRLTQAGFTPEDDAILYEYVERWLFNNQNSPWSNTEKAELILDSIGVFQYKHTGTVPIEDD